MTLDTVTLDQVMEREAGTEPVPDFLSLDTQGSELEILRGANHIVENDVVAIMTEVEFIPVYQDQPLLNDITGYLAAKGFELASLTLFPTNGASNRTPIGLRGAGFPQGGEALFLRRPDTIDRLPNNNLLLLKQAFIAFLFGFFDRTFAIMSRIPTDFLGSLMSGPGKDYGYLAFLNAYGKIASSYPGLFPIKYSDVFSAERSAKRFLSRLMTVDRDAVRAKYFASADRAAVMDAIGKLQSEDFVGIEVLANQFQLAEQAEQLRQHRRQQVDGLLKWLRREQTAG